MGKWVVKWIILKLFFTVMIRATDVLVDDIAFQIGIEMRRSEKMIVQECKRLRENWFASLRKWNLFSTQQTSYLPPTLPFMPTCRSYCTNSLVYLISHEEWLNTTKSRAFINNPQPSMKAPYSSQENRKENSTQKIVPETCQIMNITQNNISLCIGYEQFDLPLNSKLSDLSRALERSFSLHEKETNKILDAKTSLCRSLVPGNSFEMHNTKENPPAQLIITSTFKQTAVDAWLVELGLGRYRNVFRMFDFEDFLALPFLSESSLLAMGIEEEYVQPMIASILNMRELSSCEWLSEWLKYEGFGHLTSVILSHKLDLRSLLAMSEPDLRKIKELAKADESFWKIVGEYKKYSSVEESFKWLRAHNFEKYSFHFGRFNIPFYALPFVNFFIVNEMGCTIDDQELLDALRNLKDSPTYNAKAVTFWLRDLEMETYSTMLAKANFSSLNEFNSESEPKIEKLMNMPSDFVKFQTGIREMKEFQFYYSATSYMLCELGLERYSELFVQHAISIDFLPLMTDSHLIDIGVKDSGDRERILKAIKKINPNQFPSVPGFSNYAKRTQENLIVHNANTAADTDKSVDDWLQFINGSTHGNSKKNAKKKKRRRRSPKKISQSSTKDKSRIEQLEKHIIDQLNNKQNPIVEENTNNLEVEEFLPIAQVNNYGAKLPENEKQLEKLVIQSPQFSGENVYWDSVEADNFELDTLDAEVEEFRKRLEAASLEVSCSPIFSSID